MYTNDYNKKVSNESDFNIYKTRVDMPLKKLFTGLAGRLFANGPGHQGLVPGHVIPKT